MKKIYFYIITIVTISFASCSQNNITSSDIEGEWKMYKIKYPNSYQFTKVTDDIYFKFTNTDNSSGKIEIYSENASTLEGEYELAYNSELTIVIPESTLYSNLFYAYPSVGVLKITNNSYNYGYEYIFIRE